MLIERKAREIKRQTIIKTIEAINAYRYLSETGLRIFLCSGPTGSLESKTTIILHVATTTGRSTK